MARANTGMKSLEVERLAPEFLNLLRRHNLIEQLIRTEFIDKTVNHIKLKDNESSTLLENYAKKNGIRSESDFQEHLNKRGLRKTDLLHHLELPIKIQRHANECYINKAEARFLECKDRLDRVTYSLIRVKKPELARELYLRIIGNESSFSDVAVSYSEGPEKNSKGLIGPLPLTQAHPILAEKLRTSAEGELMEPFRIDGWWLIARLEQYQPSQFNETVAQTMCTEMFNEWVKRECIGIIDRLQAADKANK
tara:strand:+ start:338 stop:1093 length:756 start_codon:yes stop_codon:yes gene_type:complete